MIEGIYKCELETDVFPLLNHAKMAKVNDRVIDGMKNFYHNKPTTNNFSRINKHNNYRSRIKRLYDKLEGIRPIDNTISDVMFLNDEMISGFVIRQNIANIKQTWIEYRLMYNVLNLSKIPSKIQNKKIDFTTKDSYVLKNFDTLFDKLCSQFNIDLPEINKTRMIKPKELNNLEKEKAEFQKEKADFLKEMQKSKEELALRFNRLEILTNKLKEKYGNVID